MGATTRWTVLLAFVATTSAPMLARLAGMEAQILDNRAPTTVPTISTKRLFRVRWYQRITTSFTERLPLRNEAIRANSWLRYNLFRESPSKRVLLGDQDWLYFERAVRGGCAHRAKTRELAQRLSTLGAITAASGRELRVVVAPNKLSIYPDHFPDGNDKERARDRTSSLYSELTSFPSLHASDAYTSLVAARSTTGALLYSPSDTHWTPTGAAIGVRALLDSFDAGLWASASLHVASDQPAGKDLLNMAALRSDRRVPSLRVVRDGVRSLGYEKLAERSKRLTTASDDDVPILQGTTLLFGDSFSNAMLRLLQPYTQDLRRVHWRDTEKVDLVNELGRSRRVVIEVVQRDFCSQISRQLPKLEAAAVAAWLYELEAEDIPALSSLGPCDSASSKLSASVDLANASISHLVVEVETVRPPKLKISGKNGGFLIGTPIPSGSNSYWLSGAVTDRESQAGRTANLQCDCPCTLRGAWWLRGIPPPRHLARRQRIR